ncbi:MAG: NAD(P)/FAD-dependent oxidoreductase [Candidatus Omnitrophica bacterium]|nr:NAD(P)/FAD-dependent oxidoreductase [Candidatus Omnitrophota bacterium]
MLHNSPLSYDIAMIGAGPAGIMAAVRAMTGKSLKVILIEKNSDIGRKILISGKGRCNITNDAPVETFVEEFGKQGKFLRSAFFRFSSQDLRDLLEKEGLKLKVERQGRLFPATDRAVSVVKTLQGLLSKKGIEIIYNSQVSSLKKADKDFVIGIGSAKDKIRAKKVILSTGGASYKVTGSSGDGFKLARALGHTITPLKPGLVPLKVKERWAMDLQGLSLKNVRFTFKAGREKIVSEIGEASFTHFGVSGPLVLDLSRDVISMLDNKGAVKLLIDLKPGIEHEELGKRLLREFSSGGSTIVRNAMKTLLPSRLALTLTDLCGVDPEKKASQITRSERHKIVEHLKALPLTIIGSLPLEEAMVTCGGVSIKEIDPRTMESKLVPGLYFAGEIIDGCAKSGGYNMQQAFSTGFLAGEAAANA